jgi:hypothetical protein
LLDNNPIPIVVTPTNIKDLWYLIDKRLSAIETAQKDHLLLHAVITKTLDDHETRLRSAGTVSTIMSGSGGLLALIAIIKAFFG